MNLAFKIAKRYFFSKKSTNAINVISWVSVIGMMVGTLALILVLSVFNGFEDLVTSLYNTFNPDLKVMPIKEKTFVPDSAKIVQIQQIDGVEAIAYTLEENVLMEYGEQNQIVRLKGVDSAFTQVSSLDTAIFDGEYKLTEGATNYAILGVVIQDRLAVNVRNPFAPLRIYLPKRTNKRVNSLNPIDNFIIEDIYPAGSFFIQQDFDAKYAIVPLRLMRRLLERDKAVSALEIAVDSLASAEQVQAQIQAILGDEVKVNNRYQQDAFLYKVMRTEKWAVYLILTLVLIVAAFNIIGSLSMLVIEKRFDIGILKAMGATKGFIRRIFFMEGILLSLIGAFIGCILAVIICLVQQHFKIVKLQGVSFLIDAYPVSMRFYDFVLVFFTVVIIAILASIVPSRMAAEQSQLLKEE